MLNTYLLENQHFLKINWKSARADQCYVCFLALCETLPIRVLSLGIPNASDCAFLHTFSQSASANVFWILFFRIFFNGKKASLKLRDSTLNYFGKHQERFSLLEHQICYISDVMFRIIAYLKISEKVFQDDIPSSDLQSLLNFPFL